MPDSPSKDSIPAKPPQARPRPLPAVPDSKGPKKLSDVKVSANIAASLGNIKLSSPAASPSSGSAARGAASGATTMPATATAMPASTTAAPSHMDLLGGLDAPAPAAAPHGTGQEALAAVTAHVYNLALAMHLFASILNSVFVSQSHGFRSISRYPMWGDMA